MAHPARDPKLRARGRFPSLSTGAMAAIALVGLAPVSCDKRASDREVNAEPAPTAAAVSRANAEGDGAGAGEGASTASTDPGANDGDGDDILQGCAMLDALAGDWSFRTQALGGRMSETIGATGTFAMHVEVANCKATATVRRRSGGLAFRRAKTFSGDQEQVATTELRFIGDDSGRDVLAYGFFELRSRAAKAAGKGPEVENNFAFRPVDGELYGYWTRAGDRLSVLGTLHGVKGNEPPTHHAVYEQPCEVQCMFACENLEHGEDSLQQADPAACVSSCRAGKVATCGPEQDIPSGHVLDMSGPFADEAAACKHMEGRMRARNGLGDVAIACNQDPSFRLYEEDRRTASPAVPRPDDGAKWSKGTLYWLYSRNGEGPEEYFAAVKTAKGWFVSDRVTAQGRRVPADAAGTVDEITAIDMFTAPLTDAPGDEFIAVVKSETGPDEAKGRPRNDLAVLCSVREDTPRCLKIQTRWGSKSVHLTALPSGRVSLRAQSSGAPEPLGVFRWGG